MLAAFALFVLGCSILAVIGLTFIEVYKVWHDWKTDRQRSSCGPSGASWDAAQQEPLWRTNAREQLRKLAAIEAAERKLVERYRGGNGK